MNQKIHPTYHNTSISCACGNTLQNIGSTKENIRVELCAKCHPFYTGKQKIIDTAGRVERYHKLLAKKESFAPSKKIKRPAAKKELKISTNMKSAAENLKKIIKKEAPL